MSQPEAWSIGRLLTWTTDFLKRHNSSSPRLDSELLLSHALQCERIQLYTRYDEAVDDATRTRFRELVKQRSEGTPVAYLLGRREFYSLSFIVGPAVLIPRPETEFAVIAVLDRLKERGAEAAAPRIVDVGTGSGAIAVTLAVHAPTAQVTAIDLSESALSVAKANAQAHEVTNRITFLQGNLLDPLPPEATVHFVVSNPPYVSQAEYDELVPEVRDHEPRLALLGGTTGTEIIAKLIPQAAERLVPGGWLMLEISPMMVDAVRTLLETDRHWEAIQVVRDLAQLPRIVCARRR